MNVRQWPEHRLIFIVLAFGIIVGKIVDTIDRPMEWSGNLLIGLHQLVVLALSYVVVEAWLAQEKKRAIRLALVAAAVFFLPYLALALALRHT